MSRFGRGFIGRKALPAGPQAFEGSIPPTAPPIPPLVTTGAATGITGTQALLNATVNPEGFDATVYFQWGATIAYGNQTASQDAGAGLSTIPFTAPLAGLFATATIHYRAVAVSSAGTVYGADRTFATIDTYTLRLLDSWAPWLAQDSSGHLRAWLTAIGSMFEQVYGIVADHGDPQNPATFVPGWSTLLDPDNAPTWALPFTAQFNGTNVQPGTSDADARAIIKAESGFNRGTASSIIAAAQRNLTGTQSVSLLERTPGAYGLVLVVRPEELPSLSGLLAAITAVKPAGITVTVVQTDGWSLFQMEASQATITPLEAAFTTITGLEGDQVGH